MYFKIPNHIVHCVHCVNDTQMMLDILDSVSVFNCDDILQETWMFVVLTLLPIARSFYVPGVAPMNFHQNSPVEIKVRHSDQELLLTYLFV